MNLRILVLLAGLSGGALHADLLTFTVTPDAGMFRYEFTLTNTGDTGGPLNDLFLQVATPAVDVDDGSIGTPYGWGDAAGGFMFFGQDTGPENTFFEWSACGSDCELQIGSWMDGFSFSTYSHVDQPILYSLNGSADFFAAETDETAAVPEPGTVMLLLASLLAVGFRSWLRGKARRRTG
jgi:hypothetical protein